MYEKNEYINHICHQSIYIRVLTETTEDKDKNGRRGKITWRTHRWRYKKGMEIPIFHMLNTDNTELSIGKKGVNKQKQVE